MLNDSLDHNALDEWPGLEQVHYVRRLAGDLPQAGTSNILLNEYSFVVLAGAGGDEPPALDLGGAGHSLDVAVGTR
jgi:hypothetical protein